MRLATNLQENLRATWCHETHISEEMDGSEKQRKHHKQSIYHKKTTEIIKKYIHI